MTRVPIVSSQKLTNRRRRKTQTRHPDMSFTADFRRGLTLIPLAIGSRLQTPVLDRDGSRGLPSDLVKEVTQVGADTGTWRPQSRVHSASDDTSLTNTRLPEIAG